MHSIWKTVPLVLFVACLAFTGDIRSEEAEDLKTVISNGLGSTFEDALKNAAENALTQVVGEFIDTETQIEKRTEITDGLKSQTKSIDKRFATFSQGSIKNFEVLDSSESAGIFKVTAKVEVRIKDFRAFIKNVAEGETTITDGFFAQVATEQKNQDSVREILIEKVFKPFLLGEALEFDVGSPQLYGEWLREDSENQNAAKSVGRYSSAFSFIDSTIVIAVGVKINDGYLQNTRDVFESLATKRTTTNSQRRNQDMIRDIGKTNSVFGIKGAGHLVTYYYFKDSSVDDSRGSISDLSDISLRNLSMGGLAYPRNFGFHKLMPTLNIQLVASDNTILNQEDLESELYGSKWIQTFPMLGGNVGKQRGVTLDYGPFAFLPSSTFYIFMNLPAEDLSQVATVRVILN